MSTKLPDSFSSVLSVNPYNDSYVNNISNVLQESNSVKYDKKQFTISYLNTRYFINSQIEISANIPEEDIEDAIYNKAYDELALDQALEYKIKYIEVFNKSEEDSRIFQVFIVNPNDIVNTYNSAVKRINYIDIIIPNPLLLKSLYTKEIIKHNDVDCFIYIQENDAFIAIYENQEFIYNKSINYSLKQIHEKFCEYYGESISYNDFLNFISTKNLRTTESKYKEHIIKIYKELFTNINEILTYIKRAFEIEKIDTIYIGSAISTVTKLYEMAEVELNIRSNDFDFNYGYRKGNTFIEPLHSLMHLYTTLDEDERYNCNFTTYQRPPKFQKRLSGKMIIIIAASIIIAFAYPVTNWILSSAQDAHQESLESDYSKIHSQKVDREKSIKKITDEKKRVTDILKDEKNEYFNKKNTLIKIHDVKVNYPMKAKIIALLANDISSYNVYLEALSYKEFVNERNFNLYLIAKSDKEITNLVKYLTKKYHGEFLFSLKKIYLEKESGKYFTELKTQIQ